MAFRIESIHAFVAVDDDDEEGIIGQLMANGTWMPFVAADYARLQNFLPLLQQIADQTGKEIRHIRLSLRDDLETYQPRGH